MAYSLEQTEISKSIEKKPVIQESSFTLEESLTPNPEKRDSIIELLFKKNENTALIQSDESLKEEENHSEKEALSEPGKYDHLMDDEEKEDTAISFKSFKDESIFNKITSLCETSDAELSDSQNIDDLLSMIIDALPLEPLLPKEGEAIIEALQESVDMLKMLEYTIPAKIDKRWDESYKTMAEKYDVPEEGENIFREEIGLLPLVPTVAEKLQQDRTYICNVFEKTLQNLKENRRFDALKDEVENIAKTIEDERALKLEHEIWTDLITKLQDTIASQEVKDEEELKKFTEIAENADVEADESIFFNSSKLDYVKRWEADRLNQKNMRIALEEQKIIEELNKIAKKERAQRIISEDTKKYYHNYMAHLRNEIKKWTNDRKEEVLKTQREIYNLTEAIDEREETLEELNTLCRDRQAFIDKCNEEKARVKREMEYQKTVNRAATIIQSFWRGYMVRKELGEYKGLRAKLRKRKKLAAIARKKRAAWQKKKAKDWGETKLKTMKNIVDRKA